MPTIRINNAEIYYELHGQGEPLILIAGYCCDHLFWEPMLNELKHLFQVLVFDNRGIGRTKDDNAPFTIEQMAEDTMALANQLGLERPNILGQSMGGAIAQTIARNHAKKLNKLFILNSTSKFSKRTGLALDSLLMLRENGLPIDPLIEVSLPWFFSSEFLAIPQNIIMLNDAYRNNPYPQSIENQARQLAALHRFNSQSWLHQINLPTHIITAENDIITTVAESRHLATEIDNTSIDIIPGGHSSPLEEPEEVIKSMMSFWLKTDEED